MKRTKPTVWTLLGAVAALGTLACGSPCNDFNCSNCATTAEEAACVILVELNNDDACQRSLDTGELNSCK